MDIGLNYETFWGSPDIRAPREVKVEHGGGRHEQPYVVEINEVKLRKFLAEEGVEKGRGVNIRFVYPENGFAGKLLGGNNSKDRSDEGIMSGRARKLSPNEADVGINMTTVYEYAAMTSGGGTGEFLERFNLLVGHLLGHEIEHLRQEGGVARQNDHESPRGLWLWFKTLNMAPKAVSKKEIEAEALAREYEEKMRQIVTIKITDEEKIRRSLPGVSLKQMRETVEGAFKQN